MSSTLFMPILLTQHMHLKFLPVMFFQFTGFPNPHNIQSSTPMMFLTCLFLYVLSEIKGEKSQCSWINETLQDTMIKCLKCTIGITSVWYETSYTIFQWPMPQQLAEIFDFRSISFDYLLIGWISLTASQISLWRARLNRLKNYWTIFMCH